MITKMFKSVVILLLFIACTAYCNATLNCTQTEVYSSYLDVATDMISKAKLNVPTCDSCENNLHAKPTDCLDVLHMGQNKSGVYKVFLMNRVIGIKHLHMYCDMEKNGGGWTVIQRRRNDLRPDDYFFKDWKSYKEGFGDIEGDFWLGNDNIFALTNQKLYSIRFDLKDTSLDEKYALYDNFWIDDEAHKYALHISDYSGNAGDSMTLSHNNQKFSTKDQENEEKENSCGNDYKGGWWYNKCVYYSNLNGLARQGKVKAFVDGIIWQTWKGHHESLAWTEIKIRPKDFRSIFESVQQPMQND